MNAGAHDGCELAAGVAKAAAGKSKGQISRMIRSGKISADRSDPARPLIEGGEVRLGVLGCPNLPNPDGSTGAVFLATDDTGHEVAFKVLPAPAAAACLSLTGLSHDRAVAAMSAALGSPFEVNGAAHLPQTGQTLLRIEGFATSVAYRAERLADLLAPFGPAAVNHDGAAVAAIWRDLRDVAGFAGRTGDVWRLSVKPSDAPALAARIGGEVIFDLGGGLIWALVAEGTDLRARLGDFAGHATLIRADAATRARIASFQPEPAPLAAIAARLRAQFDPRGILNPGLMTG